VKTNSLSSLRAALCASAFAAWIPGCLPDGTSPELPLSMAGAGGGSGSAAGSGFSGNSAAGSTAGAGAGAGRGATGAAGASGMASAAGRAAAGAGGGRAGSGAAGMAAAGRSGAPGAAGSTAGASGMMGMAGRSGAGAGAPAAGMGGRGGMGGMPAAGMSAAGGGAGAAGGGAAATTFTQVYGLIMTGCGCHVSGTSGGLSMANKMSAYMNLVGANSTACSGQKRVVANDPTNSVFFHSIERTMLGSCNVPQMPAGGAKMAQADIDKVKAWIMAGAMNN
jgi:hypothetical protein